MNRLLKIYNFLLPCLLFIGLTTRAQVNDNQNGPMISFDKTTHDYGEIFMHGDGNSVFKFTNTGNEPLILTNVRAGCGCTVPSWPREPINPGESGNISVRYTTLNREHEINRSIVVTSNAVNNSTQVLRLVGKVVAPPPEFSPEKMLDRSATPSSR